MKQLVCLLSGASLLALIPGSMLAQPANDTFANSWQIDGTSVSTNGDSTGATSGLESGEPNHGGVGARASVWFHWTAPATGITRIDTLGSSFNTVLAVYTGSSVSTLSTVAANNDADGGTSASRVYFVAIQGTRYEIAIAGIRRQNPTVGPYTLNLQMLPYVGIVSPTNGAIFPTGANLPLSVDASTPNGSVSKVDFYHDGILFYTAVTPPFGASYASPPVGTNSFFAVVTDSASQTWTSAVVSVLVGDVSISLTLPGNGDSFFGTAPIPVTATGYSATSIVARVEFLADGVAFAQDTTSPYSATWDAVTPGNHALSAVLVEDSGFATTSAPVNITVTGQSLVFTGAIWKYLDDGSDQGTAWTAPAFNDGGWASGPAEMGYGDDTENPPRPEATVVGYGPDPGNKYITTYFRHNFVVKNAASYTNLVLDVMRDDGAVVYLNGVEAARFHMPEGPIDYLTPASTPAVGGTDEYTFFPMNIDPGLLVEGTNVLAAEIHQDNVTSSDISFDLDLVGQGNPSAGPTVAFTSPTDHSTFLAPANITLTVDAKTSPGTITNVQFFVGGSKLGQVTSSPFTLVWSNVVQGIFTLRAIAKDSGGLSATSAPVTIAVSQAVSESLALVDPGSVWKYLDDGSDQGTAWIEPSFDDTTWASGPGELGYGDLPEGHPEATVLCCSNAAVKSITYYFRHRFALPNANIVTNLTLSLLRDDGAAVYLNGHEIVRDGLPPGALYDTLASQTVGGTDEATYFEFQLAPSWLVSGDNVLAVEVHQASTSSSDISFDLGLTADAVITSNQAPIVALTSPADGAVYQAPTNVTLSATATDFDGIAHLEFYADTTLLGQDSTSPYSLTWNNPAPGTYALSAVAVDNQGTRGTSSVARVTINAPPVNTDPPVIISVNPPAGSSVGSLTAIQVTFSETVTGVDASDLLINGNPATSVTENGTTYTFLLTQPSYGTALITWANNHGIVDIGYPPLPFDGTAPDATWSYNILDTVPPVIIAQDPPADAFVTNLVQYPPSRSANLSPASMPAISSSMARRPSA